MKRSLSELNTAQLITLEEMAVKACRSDVLKAIAKERVRRSEKAARVQDVWGVHYSR